LGEPVQDTELKNIFDRIHRTHFSGNGRIIEAEFYPYRSLRHTVQWSGRKISARVSRHFQDAPGHILEILALILLSKVYHQRVDGMLRKIYRTYSHDLQKNIPVAAGRSVNRYIPVGKHFDLEKIFDDLNRVYFRNTLKVGRTGWSLKKSYRRLGFYDARRDLLVISKIFDHSRVPVEVVKYLVYHEMLHIQIPERTGKSRRILHPPEFRRREREFPGYQQIDDWIKRHISRL
jgi:predicted metal-dependent hydrolase